MSDYVERHGWCPHQVRGPAVDLPFQSRGRILTARSIEMDGLTITIRGTHLDGEVIYGVSIELADAEVRLVCSLEQSDACSQQGNLILLL